MTDWFRSWHGAPTDPKWLVIARKAGVVPGIVSAVVWALFDHASQQEDRGDVRDFDVETFAAFSGFEETDVQAVISALRDKGIIADYRLTAWEKRQPKREDSSTSRVALHRERNAVKRDVTHGNAPEESREDTDKKEPTSLRSVGARATPKKRKSAIPDDWQPSERNRLDAQKLGLSGAQIDIQASLFRDRQKAHGAMYADWDATWRNWCQRIPEFGRGPGPPAHRGKSNGICDALDRIIENERAYENSEQQPFPMASERDRAH